MNKWRRKTLPMSIHSLLILVQHHQECPFPDLHGSESIAFKLALGYSQQRRNGMIAPTAVHKCGAKEQTAEHVITSCSIYQHPNGGRGLSAVDKSLVPWLTNRA